MENKISSSLEILFDKTREVSGIGVWQVDLNEHTVYWDKQTKLIHEVSMDFVPKLETGISFYREGHSRDEIIRLCNNIIEKGESYEAELEIVTEKGNLKWVSVIGMPNTVDGVICGFYGTFYDITEKKNKLAEIEYLKERVVLATDAGSIGVFDLDILKNELIWDDQMFYLYEVNKNDFSGAYEAWQSGLHPDDKEAGNKSFNDALSGVKPFETQFRVICPSGKIKYVKGKAKVFRNKLGEPLRMLGTNWDITAEVEKSIQLRDYSSKMKIVQDGLSIAMWKFDPVTNEANWDDAMYEMYGIPKDSKDKMAEWGAKLEPGVLEGFWAEFTLCIEREATFNKVFKIFINGREKYIRAKAEVIKNKNGSIDYILGYNIDITKEINRALELKLQNENLQKISDELKESNEQLEEFSYIASHDLKAPIRHMASYASFLEEDYGDDLDEDGRKMLKGIKDQASRMTKLVEDLFTYSRVNKMEVKLLTSEVNKIVNEAVKIIGFDTDPTIELDIQDLGVLRVDIVKIGEVFSNLLTNAVKYNTSSVKRVKVWREENLIYFEDNGIGIDEKHKEKVFAFFRRLHSKNEYGGGTGAGMAIVKTVLYHHKTTIDFTSTIGKGTKFIMDFSKCAV